MGENFAKIMGEKVWVKTLKKVLVKSSQKV